MKKSVFFRPWVGTDYRSGGIFKKKILIVGESHYCDSQCEGCGTEACSGCHSFTTDVINDYLNPKEWNRWMNTFRKFEHSLVNHKTGAEESRAIWDSVAFYNFLQSPMQSARQSGTPEQYRDAAVPFFQVLNELRPDAIIVWGCRLWNRMPGDSWKEGEKIVINNYPVQNGFYFLEDGTPVQAVCIYHPAAGYSWDVWHKVLQATVLR